MYRKLCVLFAGLIASGALVVGAALSAAATSQSTSGVVHVWDAHAAGGRSAILLTGVIGDNGTSTSITKSGKPAAHGHYVKIALKHGGFIVNAVALDRKLNGLKPKVNLSTCTFWASGGGNVTLMDGTGAYKGIHGTVRVGTSFAAEMPRFTSGAKKGQCNGNGRPIAQFSGPIIGSGHVSF